MRNNIYRNVREIQEIDEIFRLDGKVAIIVGGAGKMGQQFGTTLSYAGAIVVIIDIDESKCKNIADEISSKTGGIVVGYSADISDEKQVKKTYNKISDKLGPTTILIYNVMSKPQGYYRVTEEYSIETWKKVFDENLMGAFLCCREANQHMQKVGGGSIVLTSSIYGEVSPDQRIYKGCKAASNIYGGQDPLNTPAAYSVSKAGLSGLARYFATLWAENNIRVNVLVPGGVYDGQEESFHKEYVSRTPLRRMAVYSDYNGALLFLVSEASRYMTGASLIVDGGWSAW